MHMKTKSALVVFTGLLVAFATIFLFDYTDDYMEDRFVQAIEKQKTYAGDTFSLDALMEYYDWDVVCILLPDEEHSLKNRLGRPYKGKKISPDSWSLIFVKGKSVLAEIPIARSFLQPPLQLEEPCFERWAAIFSINHDQNGDLRLFVVGQ
ncbi:hypothetical protein SYK_21550 [Pseudodesulfovibrio nedwellii]|uniref:Uncharacterized protein n=1 Tax=Pseudodesulfovibrio nedwellii TaxID=2973072 RepID=A0ABN6S7D1_9BACT|nr:MULTISPECIES: hypothetical protein [Pseudodesulfovibrio]BDQ37795.1 hypothetical protein SYK_21550 [Pseudodesulfovibrio nedwellii]